MPLWHARVCSLPACGTLAHMARLRPRSGARSRATSPRRGPLARRGLLLQPELQRRSSNLIPFGGALVKRLETTLERLLRKFCFTEYHARSDELDPAVCVAGRLLETLRKTIDHTSNHGQTISGRHHFGVLHVCRGGPFLDCARCLRSVLRPQCFQYAARYSRVWLGGRSGGLVADFLTQLVHSFLKVANPWFVRIGVLEESDPVGESQRLVARLFLCQSFKETPSGVLGIKLQGIFDRALDLRRL